MEGLRADVARLAPRVVGAFLDRDRDGLFIFFVGVILFRVAAAVYFLAHLLVAAAPVVMLASGVACAEINRCHRVSDALAPSSATPSSGRRVDGVEVYAAIQDERAVKFDSTQGVTIANFTADASRRVVGQWGGAGGAVCEDHFEVERGGERVARRC